MPIYEYRCKACQCRFEHLLRASSEPPHCPACTSADLEQLITNSAFHSESGSHANLSAQHRKTAAARGDRQREEHRHHHEHFEDAPSPPKKES
jgi:putative FmdB family regulatory protein